MIGDVAAFLGTWTLMMAAMMLPSVAPLLRLHRRPVQLVALSVGYLAVWAATGFAAYAADMYLHINAVVVLLAAAVYELTPLKRACLHRCRTPLNFLFTNWRGGRTGALRLGASHGGYCVGCCWALMAVFVVVAMMSLAWAVAFAAVVFIQKVLPLPRWSSAATAVALLSAAVVVALT